MRKFGSAVLTMSVFAAAVVSAQSTRNLLPVPAAFEWRTGRLGFDTAFTVAVRGFADARLRRALDRTLRRLEGRTGLTFSRRPITDSTTTTLVVRADRPGMPVQGVEEDESYTLTVNEGHAELHAPTVVGVIRGLETLLQLADADSAGPYLPSVTIQDHPRFAWRGLLLDVCRHWEPVAVIERTLDAMAAVKLNVLHWHLSEDQGFRVESRRYPRLQELGSDGLYYTQAQIREVIAYARDRGIRVVPEFDMPAHSTSWFVGYPQYAAAPGPYQIERGYGVLDAVFDPTREEVYAFIEGFIGEMAALFPDAYFHIGGDEANGKQWSANPRIQAYMRAHGLKDNDALQASFNRRLLRILTRHGKRMVGWDEILHPDLPKSVVVQTWRGPESLGQSARQGFQGLLSAGYYLDAMAPAESHYGVDPVPDSAGLTPEQAQRILGGEICMWGEVVTPETIDSRVWPRTAAVAERLWSPRTVTDVEDLYRRLRVLSARLEELGLSTETHTHRMLLRIAPGVDLAPLRTLLAALEPVNLGGRMNVDPATQLTPLTALSDAARPDPPLRRDLAGLIHDLRGGDPTRAAAARERLSLIFQSWRDAAPGVAAIAVRAVPAREGVPLAQELADLGAAGQEALSYVASASPAPQAWREARAALLERLQHPQAHLRFTVLPAMRELIQAAAGGP
ncbi:MAG TPA: family 20 glycosylhydrolase [Gemmatimonadales bacterium]|nr:family 20 glycosylhydrolase [Gemmatimonadales bacterium]